MPPSNASAVYAVVLVLAGGLGMPSTSLAQPPTSRPAAGSFAEEAVWAEVVALRRDPVTTQPYATWFDQTLRKRQTLVEKTRLYLTLYPGGAHQAEAVRTELTALYELAVIGGGSFGRLRARVQELLHEESPDNSAVWEAAYWDILCQRFERAQASSQPAAAVSVLRPDQELLAAYGHYVTRYPHSPYVPRMAAALFDDALAAGDTARMEDVVTLLEREFPDHLVTSSVAAEWKRERAVGRQFWLSFDQPEGGRLDTREWVGRPVLIVVWASTAESEALLIRVEALRQEHPELSVVGVNVDVDVGAMRATCDRLGLAWPEFNDGLGPANRFAREWGVRQTPRVFAVDGQGRLSGSAGEDGWEPLAQRVITAPPR
jgi:hypothetical protein